MDHSERRPGGSSALVIPVIRAEADHHQQHHAQQQHRVDRVADVLLPRFEDIDDAVKAETMMTMVMNSASVWRASWAERISLSREISSSTRNLATSKTARAMITRLTASNMVATAPSPPRSQPPSG